MKAPDLHNKVTETRFYLDDKYMYDIPLEFNFHLPDDRTMVFEATEIFIFVLESIKLMKFSTLLLCDRDIL